MAEAIKARAQEYAMEMEKTMSTSLSGSGKVDVGGTAIQKLRQALRLSYGSTVAAWRTALDPKLIGGVSQGKFLLEAQNCDFSGNIKQLWEDLSCGRSSVSFQEIDGEAAGVLSNFRKLLLDKYGSLLQAWEQGIDPDAIGRIDIEEFLKACEVLEVSPRLGKRLFKYLLERMGQRSLSSDDLQALLIGIPPDQAAAVWMGPA